MWSYTLKYIQYWYIELYPVQDKGYFIDGRGLKDSKIMITPQKHYLSPHLDQISIYCIILGIFHRCWGDLCSRYGLARFRPRLVLRWSLYRFEARWKCRENVPRKVLSPSSASNTLSRNYIKSRVRLALSVFRRSSECFNTLDQS